MIDNKDLRVKHKLFLVMISFDNDESNPIPIFIKDRISLQIVDQNKTNTLISCKFPWTIEDRIQERLDSYKDINKIVFVFLVSDCDTRFNIPSNVRFFRTSINKTEQQHNEYVLPYIWEGLNERFNPLPKTDKPMVGFCGVNSTFRQKTISLLEQNENIDTQFIIRSEFWGGRPHDKDLINHFQENIRRNHFTVCNRGAGNFSIRFYQVLSAGRIPIVLDTDIVLPFDGEIDWDNTIILAKTEEDLIKKLFYVWNNNDIVSMQNRCYEIYKNYFSDTKYLDRVLSENDSILFTDM